MRLMLASLCAACLFAGEASAQNPSPESFAGVPQLRSAALSPNGRYVALIREQGETSVLAVIDIEAQSGTSIQSIDRNVGELLWVNWKTDNRLIFSVSQTATFESRARTGTRINRSEDIEFDIQRVMAIDRDGANGVRMFAEQERTLVRGLGSTLLVDYLTNDAEHVLLTAQDNLGVGVWRANVNTGRVERVANGAFDTVQYVTDGNGAPVVRVDTVGNGAGYQILRRAPGADDWIPYREFRRTAIATNSPDFQVLGSAPGAGQVYVLARQDDRDRLGLYIFDAATGQFAATLREGVNADINSVWIDRQNRVIASCEYAQRMACVAQDANVGRHLRGLTQFLGEDTTPSLVDVSSDGSVWLIHASGPSEPGAYYVFDRAQARIEPLGEIFPNAPREEATAPVQVVPYQARDGTALWAYVTARPGSGPRPLVVMPHGGPEARDYHDYEPIAQFLASRGYVVVQPNFRGSYGLGRAFADAGRGQWGLRMQDDISDAVRSLVDAGVADPQRVCIVGASYGGYAALAGVSLTPELYRCAVAIAGVSDLLDILRTERLDNGRQSSSYQYWLRSIGDPAANRDALIAASPARLANRITAPVLLIHGDEDEIVLFSQSETMQRALERAGKSTRLIRLEGEGHLWARWREESRVTVLRELDAFLRAHLGND